MTSTHKCSSSSLKPLNLPGIRPSLLAGSEDSTKAYSWARFIYVRWPPELVYLAIVMVWLDSIGVSRYRIDPSEPEPR
jgi:hypothetical protein